MDRPKSNRSDVWLAIALAAGTLALLLATLDRPIITWDEGATISRESLVRGWFERLLWPAQGVSRRQLFQEPAISTFWPFARQEPDGHPPFYAVIGNLGWLVSHSWLPPLESHRFGPIVLFSFTTGVMVHFLARRWGRLAGVAAATSWILMPRVFAHAHLASYDIPLACLWFLSVVAFWKVRECWPVSPRAGLGWSVVFAALLAMAAATKFTGWLIPLPLLVWSAAAGSAARRNEGKSSLKQLIPLAIFCGLWLVAVPEVIRFVRELNRGDLLLSSSLKVGNAQERAARVTSMLRANDSGWLPLMATFVPPTIWVVAAVARRRLKSFPNVQGAGPISQSWTAAIALTPTLTILLVPTWWPDPLRGVAIFLWSNLTRQKTTWIPTQFFGTLHEFALPWYNTLAWVGLTVPPLNLLLIICGTIATICRTKGERERGAAGVQERGRATDVSSLADQSKIKNQKSKISLAWLMLLNASTLLVIRALPGAPGHDGERQLLGSFPFLACLAGLGAEWLRVKLASIAPINVANWAARVLVGGSFVWSASAIWHFRAAPLSYYTELVGGLRGATRLGLEPTYYWDAIDQGVLDWLNQNTRLGESVLFCNDFRGLQYLRQWGKLRVSQFPHEPGAPTWYVLQNRPGLFAETPWNRWLAEHGGLAAFTHELDGVPLIWIFPIDAHEEAIRQTKRADEGR